MVVQVVYALRNEMFIKLSLKLWVVVPVLPPVQVRDAVQICFRLNIIN
jgi:hypothetical protein